jgi:hypothetical protein
MSVTIKKEYSNNVLESLLREYRRSNLSFDASYLEIRSAIKEVEGRVSDEEKSYIISTSLNLSPDIFEISDDEGMDNYDFFIGFNNFCKTLHGAISRHKPEFGMMKAVVRKPLPELKDFELFGNNDLDISYQPSNYCLTYGS